MQFLYPSFLWALLALAIPIIIHLFYFRRFKRVYFTNVRYLRELKEETSSRSRLRNLILLLMRMLAIACLVFAFAQPFIPTEKEVKTGTRQVALFVDNSFSMSQVSDKVPLFEQGREMARDIIRAYGAADRFQILSNAGSGAEQFLLSKEDALNKLNDLELTPGSRQANSVVRSIQQTLSRDASMVPVAYVISDFQTAQWEEPEFADTTIQWNLVPLTGVRQNNVAIDSAWLAAPVQLTGQSNQLLVQLRNYSDQPVDNVRLSWEQSGQVKPVGTRNLIGGGTRTDTIAFQPERSGWQSISLQITDYPVQFDDTYHIAFNATSTVRVLLIHEGTPDPYLRAAFRAPGYFQTNEENVNRLNYSALASYDLVVVQGLRTYSTGLEKALSDYAVEGGNVLLFPRADVEPTTYRDAWQRMGVDRIDRVSEGNFEVSTLNDASFVFRKVYTRLTPRVKLPRSSWRLELQSGQSSLGEWLMRYADGRSYMLRFPRENGNVFLCAAPIGLEHNDLVQHAEVFIPMLFRMAVSGSSRQRASYTIGRDEAIELDIQPTMPEGSLRVGTDPPIIPGVQPRGRGMILSTGGQIKEAGVYPLTANDSTLALLAYNYDRTESQQAYLEASALRDQWSGASIWEGMGTENIGQQIIEAEKGIILWQWFVVLTLIFLALETLILRFWKT